MCPHFSIITTIWQSLEPGPEVFEPSPAPARFVMPITFGNLMYGTTEGGEVIREFQAYGSLDVKPRLCVPANASAFAALKPGHVHPWRNTRVPAPSIRRSCVLTWISRTAFRGTPARISSAPSPIQGVTSYTRIDAQFSWKITERGEISVVGQNLLRNDHLESFDALTLVNSSLIKRAPMQNSPGIFGRPGFHRLRKK